MLILARTPLLSLPRALGQKLEQTLNSWRVHILGQMLGHLPWQQKALAMGAPAHAMDDPLAFDMAFAGRRPATQVRIEPHVFKYSD